MRLRPAIVGLCLAACTPTGGADADSDATTGLPGTTGSTSTGTSTDGALPTTGGATALTDGSTGGGDSSGGDDTGVATTTSTTGPDDTTGAPETTGDPVGPPADCPRVRVMVPPGQVLNVRPDPSTAMEPVGSLANGALADVVAFVKGEVIEGNGEWVQIATQTVSGYVWSGLVQCTLDEPSDVEGFFLPLECGFTATVSQGNFSDFSHQGQSAYAFDFSLGSGTPLVAIADGTVSHLYNGTKPGDPCYNGGGMECIYSANFVVVQHGDGTSSAYAHLSEVHVTLNQFVKRGTPVGLSGSSGWSTGRHAHVARQENCPYGWCQTIAVTFADVPGDGVPDSGQVVTSGNCP